jgi:hypothetical protein
MEGSKEFARVESEQSTATSRQSETVAKSKGIASGDKAWRSPWSFKEYDHFG